MEQAVTTVLTLYMLLLLTTYVYGVFICFSKKWYLGLIALVVPLFATVVSITYVIFKKELLK